VDVIPQAGKRSGMIASATMDNPVLPYFPELVAAVGVLLVLVAIVGLIVMFARRLRRIEGRLDASAPERSVTEEATGTAQPGTEG
jgi:hypothetical protein